MRLRCFWGRAWPSCRAVRLSAAECPDFCAACGVRQVGDKAGRIEPLVGSGRQVPGRSRGMAMDHIQRGAPFGMAVCLRQVALHDQARAVLHRRRPMKHGIAPVCRGTSWRAGHPGRRSRHGWRSNAARPGRRPWHYGSGGRGGASGRSRLRSVRSDPQPWRPVRAVSRSSSGGAASAFGGELSIEAQALTGVPSTGKRSSGRSGAIFRCARTAAPDIDVSETPLRGPASRHPSGHEPQGGAWRGFRDRLGIRLVVFLAFAEWVHTGRRHQTHFMTVGLRNPAPAMRRDAGLPPPAQSGCSARGVAGGGRDSTRSYGTAPPVRSRGPGNRPSPGRSPAC